MKPYTAYALCITLRLVVCIFKYINHIGIYGHIDARHPRNILSSHAHFIVLSDCDTNFPGYWFSIILSHLSDCVSSKTLSFLHYTSNDEYRKIEGICVNLKRSFPKRDKCQSKNSSLQCECQVWRLCFWKEPFTI